MTVLFSRPPAARLPDRRGRDEPWTPVYEPGPVRRWLGFVCRVVGRVLSFVWW